MKKAIELIKKGLQELESQAQDATLQASPTETPRFKKLSDGWVRDNLLGLDWGQSSTKCINYADAEKHCASVGGRLPEIRELHSLVDYSKYKPAINEIFADTKVDDYYWTATLHPHWQNSAWVVGFSYGYVGSGDKVHDGCVRPCRASQCLDIL